MGICASCLGLQRHSDRESSETSRLLFDDPYQAHYGGLDQNGVLSNTYQADPQDLKREREALEAICQRTSENVIDIFALLPHHGDATDKAAKVRDYRRIMDEVLRSEQPSSNGQPLVAPPIKGKDKGKDVDHYALEDVEAAYKTVKKDGVGRLYIPFGGPSPEIRSIIGSKA